MNVLMLRPHLEVGGVTAHIQLLAAGLRERGHHVGLAAAAGDAVPTLGAAGFAVQRLPLYPSNPLTLARSALRVARMVRRERIDLLHSHHRFTTIVGWIVRRLTGVPLLATVHEFKRDGRATARIWAGRVSIAPSQALKDHLVSFYGAPASRIFVVPHALDLSGDTVAPPDGTAPLVGYVGRLSPEKGVRYFVESMPLIRRRFPAARFAIVGDRPDAAGLRRRTGELGLDPQEIFWGQRQNAAALLGTFVVVVIPSLEESFSMVALEAMRAARPAVASAVGGLPEVVRDGRTGLLVPPGCSRALANAVSLLLANRVLRHQLGKRGRQVLHAEHGPDAMVERTLQAYQAALAEQRG
jgi:glycosyltransferase involved in cell wall biosynthesis